jgi:hypothetical protein
MMKRDRPGNSRYSPWRCAARGRRAGSDAPVRSLRAWLPAPRRAASAIIGVDDATASGGAPIVDSTGHVTLAWSTCRRDGSGPCTVAASVGTASGRFIVTPRLMTRGRDASAVTGLRTIALEDCPGTAPAGSACRIEVSFADRLGRFRAPVQLAPAGSIDAFAHDTGGDQLLVWSRSTSASPGLYAAAMAAGSTRFSGPRRHGSVPLNASDVTAGVGPRGEGIVTWSTAAGTVLADVVMIAPA